MPCAPLRPAPSISLSYSLLLLPRNRKKISTCVIFFQIESSESDRGPLGIVSALDEILEVDMSCNGCRVLRRGCSESCLLRPCLQWIESADAQANATVFVAKFFGRAGLMSFISSVPLTQRPALFQSLLYEACGRTINPVNGAVGLLWTGNWHLCQTAVEAVLCGSALGPLPDFAVEYHMGGSAVEADNLCTRTGFGFPSPAASRRRALPVPSDWEEEAATVCDLDLCLTTQYSGDKRYIKWRTPTTPSANSEGSVTTSGERSGGDRSALEPRLLNLFA